MAFRLGKSSALGVLIGFVIALCFTNFKEFHWDEFNPYVRTMNDTLLVKTKDKTLTPIEMRKVYDVTDCTYQVPRRKFEQRGDFWVLLNYVQAKRKFQCFESVTYTTQGEYTFLDNLVVVVNRWRGPVSVAVYAPGDDLQTAIESIAYLRNCDSVLIKKYVTFHLFFPYDHTSSLEVGN